MGCHCLLHIFILNSYCAVSSATSVANDLTLLKLHNEHHVTIYGYHIYYVYTSFILHFTFPSAFYLEYHFVLARMQGSGISILILQREERNGIWTDILSEFL